MDDYPLLNLFWTMLLIFLWVMWFFLLFKVITDIFRDHELNGWAKAGWLVLVLLLPFLGVFIYLIVRGRSMGERDMKQAEASEKAFQEYVRKSAGGAGPGHSPAEELAKLSSLKDKGDITPEEFAKAKERLLA
ncbi:SHOCT domain-containing protein [Streptomyces sp. NPDC060048]|uniref:SHOCT domain-containing protein n=1 Tax=unclassified Streptomyces TaxID=2593676 RepID=UPI0036779091